MAGIFKAYDVRGTYPDQIDEFIARKIGRGFCSLLDPADPAPVVVSHDMRPHSEPLESALIEGLRESGRDVLAAGLASTPMNYFAVGHLAAAGGIQVTASHNPGHYNGFKFSLREARPVSGDDGIPRIERHVHEDRPLASVRRGTRTKAAIFEDYATHLLGQLRRPAGAARLRLAADAANGMGTIYRPILERAGIELVPLYFELDGRFPHHEANPLKPENLVDLSAEVKRSHADLGVAFDGDADRAVFVDERGDPVGSDLTTALIGGLKLDRSGSGVVVYDVRSSRAVPEHILRHGGTPVRERVGHSFIKATMRAHDAVFGGELAGHYYFRENYFADSSLLAVFEILNLLWQERRPLSELVAPLRCYAKSPEINFEIEDRAGVMAELQARYGAGAEVDDIDGLRFDFPDWWFNVRPSNTEPLLRLVLEADTPELLEQRQRELVELLGSPA